MSSPVEQITSYCSWLEFRHTTWNVYNFARKENVQLCFVLPIANVFYMELKLMTFCLELHLFSRKKSFNRLRSFENSALLR